MRMGNKPVLAIVCSAFFLLTCCVGTAEEAAAKSFDARGTIEFRTASGSEAEEYQLGDTVYLYIKGNYRVGGLGPCFNCRVTDSHGSTQYEVNIYSFYFETTKTFVIDSWDPTGTWKAILTYTDHLTSPQGVKLDTDSVEVLESIPYRWAVIVDGGTIGGNLQDAIDASAREAYTVIVSRGYTEDKICLLTPYNYFDADNDGDNDQTRVATVANVQWAIETWLDASDESDNVFIYFVNHGSPEIFVVSDGNLVATTVGGWVDGVVANRLVFVIEACFSGTWEDNIADADRIFVSSADDDEFAYVVGGTIVFSHSFFTELDEGASVENAFDVAYDHVLATMGDLQHPQISDHIPGSYWL